MGLPWPTKAAGINWVMGISLRGDLRIVPGVQFEQFAKASLVVRGNLVTLSREATNFIP
jgi:hypothetical protein